MGGRYKGPSARAMAQRLWWIGREALARPEDDPVRVLGLSWYDTARAWCADLAREHRIPLRAVVGAVAALSPQCSWDSQCRYFPGFVRSVLAGDADTLPHPGFLGNRMRAATILRTGSLATLSGPKVRAFAAGILGKRNSVCVDRHAAALAAGAPVANLTARMLREVQRAYRIAARRLDIAPRDLQSLVWCHYKAKGALRASEAPDLWPERAATLTLVDLALGFGTDPARAFHGAPEPAPEPDPRSPDVGRVPIEPEPLPF